MTKCPYVPPHPWNVDFPHLMLRAKAVKHKKGDIRFRDKLLSSTDAVGKLASIPVVAQTVNAVNKVAGGPQADGQHAGYPCRARNCPSMTATSFVLMREPNSSHEVRDGARTPGKVAIYATCYINYNEPGIGHDLLKILDHNEIPVRLVEKEACCGMPKLELGDLPAVKELKRKIFLLWRNWRKKDMRY